MLSYILTGEYTLSVPSLPITLGLGKANPTQPSRTTQDQHEGGIHTPTTLTTLYAVLASDAQICATYLAE